MEGIAGDLQLGPPESHAALCAGFKRTQGVRVGWWRHQVLGKIHGVVDQHASRLTRQGVLEEAEDCYGSLGRT